MFASLLLDFDDRVKEVDLYFRLLDALDNGELEVAARSGRQVLPTGAVPADCSRMLKGASYLVLYNLVEAFIRRGFQTVFDTLTGEGLCGADLTEAFRGQWMVQRTRKVAAIDGSPKQYIDIANDIISDILKKKPARMTHERLPVSGTLDSGRIREVCDLHGVDHTVPPAAKGGVSLTTVRAKRNALAHGDESFAACGRDLTAQDLLQAKDEVVLYVRSILNNLAQFTTDQKYKI